MTWASALALSVAVAAAAGLVGCFAVMRRMSLASDAMAHVALPGIGIALALHVHPILGGMAMLLLGALLIWTLEQRTRISTETIIGVVFSAALAAGSMLATGDELIEALLGAPGALTAPEIALGLAGSVAVIAFILAQRNRLVLSLVSADIARTSGINVARLDLLYLLAFAMTVGLGLRYLGVLLMGSLIIIPAATAKLLARNLDGMLGIAVAVAVLSTVTGEYVAAHLHRTTGPVIIAIAAGLFFASAFVRRR
jgi:ABC-type Mn2+/Zn2+ transport system permease subunit